ncbi:unnamed protein product [Adineta ricciae]|nr:unnamed protein product [Adineta ricciae]
MHRLGQSFDRIFKRYKCWGEVHSLERCRESWHKIQRLFFSLSSNATRAPRHYVIFSHGNLLSGIVTYLMSGASWDRGHWGNVAPHCSVSVLSYKPGNLLPEIVLTPFQILNQSLPITINNINPRKMRLHEITSTGTIDEQTWSSIINSIIPERVIGSYTDQFSRVLRFIPGNKEEEQYMLSVFQQYCSQIRTTRERFDSNFDSDNEDDDIDETNE